MTVWSWLLLPSFFTENRSPVILAELQPVPCILKVAELLPLPVYLGEPEAP